MSYMQHGKAFTTMLMPCACMMALCLKSEGLCLAACCCRRCKARIVKIIKNRLGDGLSTACADEPMAYACGQLAEQKQQQWKVQNSLALQCLVELDYLLTIEQRGKTST